MDPFEIDMELLRRVGDVRAALTALDAAGASGSEAVVDALSHAHEQAGNTSPEAERFLSILASATGDLEWSNPDAVSRFAASALQGLEALEQRFFAPEDPVAEQALFDAGADILSVAGGSAGGSAQDEPEGAETPRADGARLHLDEIAAFFVQMDPEDRSQTVKLDGMMRDIVDVPDLPEAVHAVLSEALEVLTSVTTPKRVRKSARREAVQRVGAAVERALLTLEDVEEAVERRAVAEPEDRVAVPDTEERVEAPEPVGDERSADSPPDEVPMPDAADPDLLRDFIAEGREYIDQAEEALLALESAPSDTEAVNVVFRAFHTIKGVSGFLELGLVSDLAHHAEGILSEVRDGSLVYTGFVADLALRSADVLKALLNSISQSMESGADIRVPRGYAPLLSVLTDPDLLTRLASGDEPPAPLPSEDGEPDGKSAEGATARDESTAQSAPAGEASVRVRTDRLDRLVDMVGELVIAHSMLAQDTSILEDRGDLAKKVDSAAKILRELQDLSTSLRMVPLKPAFRKVSRLVRDLSRKSGKPLRFVSEGEDTEIDRTMVDVIADPLVHMVRNSVDHGIEPPEARAEAGKPAEGTIRVVAYQAGGTVVVEVSDDGRGLDREKIVAKAVERGLVDSDRGMTDSEVFNLIFAPGFSTADTITEVSGRGVGMDVVHRNVDSLRGRVSVESEPGAGSTFRIHLPLTLAITEGMLTRVGRERYIIPSVKIQMSLRPDPSAISTVNGRAEMVMLHGDLVPIIRLHRLFGVDDAIENPTEALLVIIGEGSRKSALLVDELVTQQQYVVKALGGIVSNITGISGGAILGNGEVGLILDPEALVSMARGESRTAA